MIVVDAALASSLEAAACAALLSLLSIGCGRGGSLKKRLDQALVLRVFRGSFKNGLRPI